jgi:hypothetical protein
VPDFTDKDWKWVEQIDFPFKSLSNGHVRADGKTYFLVHWCDTLVVNNQIVPYEVSKATIDEQSWHLFDETERGGFQLTDTEPTSTIVAHSESSAAEIAETANAVTAAIATNLTGKPLPQMLPH